MDKLVKQQKQLPLICKVHSSEQVNHFCLAKNCIVPLCSLCLEDHHQKHIENKTNGDFVILQKIVQNYQSLNNSNLSSLQSIQTYQTHFDTIYQNNCNNNRVLVQQVKEKVYEQIEQFFTNLDQTLISIETQQNKYFKNEFSNLFQYNDQMLKHSEQIQKQFTQNLNGDNIKDMINNQYIQQIDETVHKITNQIKIIENQFVSLVFNEKILDHLVESLNSFVIPHFDQNTVKQLKQEVKISIEPPVIIQKQNPILLADLNQDDSNLQIKNPQYNQQNQSVLSDYKSVSYNSPKQVQNNQTTKNKIFSKITPISKKKIFDLENNKNVNNLSFHYDESSNIQVDNNEIKKLNSITVTTNPYKQYLNQANQIQTVPEKQKITLSQLNLSKNEIPLQNSIKINKIEKSIIQQKISIVKPVQPEQQSNSVQQLSSYIQIDDFNKKQQTYNHSYQSFQSLEQSFNQLNESQSLYFNMNKTKRNSNMTGQNIQIQTHKQSLKSQDLQNQIQQHYTNQQNEIFFNDLSIELKRSSIQNNEIVDFESPLQQKQQDINDELNSKINLEPNSRKVSFLKNENKLIYNDDSLAQH